MVPPHIFDLTGFSIEFAFTVIAVVFCFLIYFRTKEIYDLTKYAGIKYFRGAFLFFGLSYLMRFVFSLLMLSRIAFDFFIPREMFAILFILPMGYFSTIGIFYLIFSTVWKKFNNRYLLVFGHVIAVLLSVVSFVTRSHFMLVGLQCALLVVAVVLSFVMHRKEKKVSRMKLLYVLVAALWLINLLVIDQKRHTPLGVELVFQAISLVVFFVIYHKISKWIK